MSLTVCKAKSDRLVRTRNNSCPAKLGKTTTHIRVSAPPSETKRSCKARRSPNGLLLMQRLPGTKYIKYGIWRCRKAPYETKTGRNLSVCSSFIRYVLQYCIVKSITSTSYRKTIASKKHSTSFTCTNLDLLNFFLQQQWNWALSFTKKKHRPLHSRHFWSRTVWRLSAASINIYLSGQLFMIQLEAQG